jgi:DNA-binding beta-propeller fold protein YncE
VNFTFTVSLTRRSIPRKESEMKKFAVVVLVFGATTTPVLADATFSLAPVGGIVMVSDHKTMIVSVPSEGKLIYFDTLAEKEVRQVEVDFQPMFLAIQGKRLFASVKGSSKIFVLNAGTAKVIKEISLPGEPLHALACHPVQGLLYAVNTANEIYSVDTEKGTHQKTTGKGQLLTVDPSGGKFVFSGIQKPIKEVLLIEDVGGGKVQLSLRQADTRALMLKYAVDGADLKLVAANDNAAVNGRGMAVSADGKQIAMAGGGGWRSKTDPKANYAVAVFDSEKMNNLNGQVDTGPYPSNVAFHPVLNLGAAFNTKEVVVFNAKSFVKKTSFLTRDNSFNHAGHLLFGGLGTKVIYCSYNAPIQKGSVLQIFSLRFTDAEKDALKKHYGEFPITVPKEIVLKGSIKKPAKSPNPTSYMKIVSSKGDFIGQGKTYDYPGDQLVLKLLVPNMIPRGIRVSVDGWNLDVGGPNKEFLQVGEYLNAKRFPLSGASPGLYFSGKGRGSSNVAGEFVLWELEMDGDRVLRFAVDFVQRSEDGPPLTGVVRFNSTLE